jgi:hypothetical protein
MAIGVLFDFPGVTQKDYDAVISKLNGGKPMKKLSDWPTKGVLFHVAGPTEKGWRVVDVWESEAAFQKFGETLVPILKSVGFPQVQPQFFKVHNLVTA